MLKTKNTHRVRIVQYILEITDLKDQLSVNSVITRNKITPRVTSELK